MSELGDLHGFLDEHEVRHALIGASALGVHGFSRSTLDTDFLVTARETLVDRFWEPLRARGWAVEVRRGDDLDPLAGVIRMRAQGSEREIDLVVGRWSWQDEVIRRAARGVVAGDELPVVTAADLALLKLDAGGPQDLGDVRALLGIAADPTGLRAEIEERLDRVGGDARAAWRQIVGSG